MKQDSPSPAPENNGESVEEADVQSGKPAAEAAFPVVGVGASAGGLNAFQRFFEGLPDQPGMAFVLVQHLAPHHESELPELLQNHTRLKVAQVKKQTKVKPNRVYVISPGKSLSIESGTLQLSTRSNPAASERLSISFSVRWPKTRVSKRSALSFPARAATAR